jgi:predicted N-acetyltransferase YhbS
VIHFLVHRKHAYTFRDYFDGFGAEVADIVRVTPYGRLRRPAEPAVYVFSDLDRLGALQRRLAGRLCSRLRRQGCTVLNDPARSLRRFALLRELHRRGCNDFNVHRADRLRSLPGRPVFLRRHDDHEGALTEPLHTPEEFESARREHRGAMAVEYLETGDDHGIHRKYSILRIGPRLVPRHVFFSRNWVVKEPDLQDAHLLEEERRFVEQDPDAAWARRIFDLARIEYGRLDYGVWRGRLQVWEINTNPSLAGTISASIPGRRFVHERFVRSMNDALRALEAERRIAIRKMRDDDLAAATAVLAHYNMDPRPGLEDAERSGIEVAHSFVAVDEGHVVGVASYLLLGDDSAETASLAVDPAYRGLGIGHRLQAARLDEMRARGIRRVRTEADRPETIRWYIERFGYREVGTNPKKHDFGLVEADHWTVLELELDPGAP